MHRIERVIGRQVPRVGLSATLGDMRLAADFLRPGQGTSVALVESKSSHSELRVLVKGYEEPLVLRNEDGGEEPEPVTPAKIALHLFRGLRGTNNLVFPNSRREVERYTYLLNRLCEQEKVPNEFWPHHGSLSKEIRSDTDRKSTRLNSSHLVISYAVFCFKNTRRSAVRGCCGSPASVTRLLDLSAPRSPI